VLHCTGFYTVRLHSPLLYCTCRALHTSWYKPTAKYTPPHTHTHIYIYIVCVPHIRTTTTQDPSAAAQSRIVYTRLAEQYPDLAAGTKQFADLHADIIDRSVE
jgi:hypothetical protein